MRTEMTLSTHRLTTANPRRTQLDALPAQRRPEADEIPLVPRSGPTANPRRTNLAALEAERELQA
jgi:hypothetical protein